MLLYWPPTWPSCHVVANQEYESWLYSVLSVGSLFTWSLERFFTLITRQTLINTSYEYLKLRSAYRKHGCGTCLCDGIRRLAKQRQRPEFFGFVLRGKTTKAPHHFPVFEHFYTPVSQYYASVQMAVLSFGRRLGQCLAELHDGTV